MKTKLFTLLLAVAASVGTMFAQGGKCGRNLTWNLIDGTLTVSGTGSMYDYDYPDNKMPWSYIRSDIRRVVINSGVTHIGDFAFFHCTEMSSVTLPNSVTSIGSNAFAGSFALKSIEIPNSVTSIESSAFENCSNLTSVTIPNSVTSIGNCTFSGCTSLASVTIPNSVTSIECDAFRYCSINIINFIGSIEDWCNKTWSPGCISSNYQLRFNGVLQENIIIPSSITSIVGDAFFGCTGLTSINIPNSVTSIGGGAFNRCTGLTTIIVDSENTAYSSEDGVLFNKDKTILLKCPEGKVGEYVIPNSVTSIESSAFENCSNLTSVTIPNSVTSIGNNAFAYCSGLTSVTLSDSIISIEETTFFGCTALTSITIPNNVTSIGSSAFQGCSILNSITIGNSVTSIGNNAFEGCSSLTSIIWNAKNGPSFIFGNQVTSFTFGDDVEVIPASICSGMTNLTSVTIGNNVTSIGSYAFAYCSGLTSVTIPNRVTSIGSYAFAYCSGLTTVTIPNRVTSIGNNAFAYCSGLTSVTLSDSIISIEETTFFGCTALTSITIPNNVTSIGSSAFQGCSILNSITIGNSVTSIEYNAFYNCSNLTSIIWNAKNGPSFNFGNQVTSFTFGDDVEVIPASICSGMTNLTSITIGNSVDSIGENAFRGCTSLASVMWNAKACKNFTYYDTPFYNGGSYDSRFDIRSQITSFTFGDTVEKIPSYLCSGMTNLTFVTIPNSVTSIGYSAFENCSGLTSVTIPNSVTSIGYSAFAYCSGLTSIEIPNSVTSIEGSAFDGCTGLTSVTIPNSVTSIGDLAFSGCTGLTSVTIGNSVTSIGDEAFWGCSGLTSVTIPNSVTSIGNDAFYNCSNLTSIIWNAKNGPSFNFGNQVTSFIFGDDVEVIPASICYGMTNLTSVTIPNSVTSIGYWAFYECSGLTSVTIPNSVTSIGDLAFYNCSGLTSIDVASKNPNYCSVNGVLLNKNRTTLISYPGGKQGAYSIPNSVTSIREGAFSGCTGLTSVTIPNSVTSIREGAFYGCTGLTSITCEVATPPTLGYEVFYDVNKSIPLYVPAGSIDLYKAADQWKDFTNILPISAQKTETTSVQAEPTDNSVSVSWPQVSGAASYELVIKDKDGNVVCTLIFNAQGQLQSIAFNAPSRDGAPQHTQTAGFSFTITGLEAGTDYNLTITAKNSNGQVVDKKEVSFKTNWPSAIENLQVEGGQSVKVYHEGQIYILRGEKVYTLQGQEIK